MDLVGGCRFRQDIWGGRDENCQVDVLKLVGLGWEELGGPCPPCTKIMIRRSCIIDLCETFFKSVAVSRACVDNDNMFQVWISKI